MALVASVPEPDLAERLRRTLAPPVALLASVFALCSLVSMVLVLRSLTELEGVDEHFVGWVGVGALACLGVAAASLLTVDRIGPGPPLALGAMAGVVALALGRDVAGQVQLGLAIVVSGLAAGGLLGGAVGMSSELPARWARAITVAWALPFVAAWPLIARAAVPAGSGGPGVVVHVAWWVCVPVTVVIVGWSVMAMLVEPIRETPGSWLPWEGPWALALGVVGVALLLAVLLGFDTNISLVWLRPVLVVAMAALVGCWTLMIVVLPSPVSRLAFSGVTVVLCLVPPTVTFAVADASSAQHHASWWAMSLVSLGAVVGAAAAGGARRLRGWSVVPLGLAVCCAAAVAVWVAKDGTAVMLVAVSALLAGAGAVLTGALRMVSSDAETSRLVGFAGVCALILGGLLAAPLSWALLGDLPLHTPQMWAAGRLYAGFTVAATGLTAAYTWVLSSRMTAPTTRQTPQRGWAGPLEPTHPRTGSC
jgi:hypothetical protein